jgi:cysteinyl-tRNA synthetase
MQTDLKVYNSHSRKLEKFEPLAAPFVGMYVCGPTVYSEVHIGNVRTFVSFDMIYRYLLHLGYKVRYVRNITDVGHLLDDEGEEDKISKRARLENIEPMEVVQKYTVNFHETMKEFNALPPSIEPTATGHLIEQIELVKTILDAGLAYESNGSVYFDVNKYGEKHNYGELSGRKTEDLLENTRDLDGQTDKRSPLDFALWKKADSSHIMKWDSEWGSGFPGWHLECSVMSTKYLGTQFDIHGGGMDLKFPHHECEIAQNTAGYGESPVKYWLHTNMLTFNGRKMAKSEGTGITPRELMDGDHALLDQAYSSMAIRFFMLQAHYRSTLDFSNEALKAAEKGYQRLMTAIGLLGKLTPSDSSDYATSELAEKLNDSMNDDFNTAVCISHLFEGVKWINTINAGKGKIDETNLKELRELMFAFCFDILGFQEKVDMDQTSRIDGLMDFIIQLRKDAKANRDFTAADQIRDRLKDIGIEIQDSREGTTYRVD